MTVYITEVFMTREMIEDCIWYAISPGGERACASVFPDSSRVSAYWKHSVLRHTFACVGTCKREDAGRWLAGEDVEMEN